MNDRLLAWVAGALDPEAEEAFEQELFESEDLARSATRFLAVHGMMRGLAKDGPLTPIVSAKDLRAIEDRCVVTKHRPIDGVIKTRIQDEDFVVGLVSLEAAPGRVHVLFCSPEGEPYFRVNEAPVDRETREVIVLCHRDRAIATAKLVVKVVDDRENVLATVSIENVP